MKKSDTTSARDRLLETADRLFYAHGIHTVGIDRVVAEAGVAKATLYAHFPSKDDLILAVLHYRELQVIAFFQAATTRYRKREKDPLLAFFAALKEWFRSEDFRGCAFQNAAIELANPDHPGTAFIRSQKKRFHTTIAQFVREALGPPGEVFVPAICILVEGAIMTALIDGTANSADVARDAAMKLLATVS
jgi:AcrR family transcriptional regulator